MASGTIIATNIYQEFVLTLQSGATNWTLLRYHACKQGKIAFIQLVLSVSADQDTSSVTIINLPQELYPKYQFESRFASAQQETDYNVIVSLNGALSIQKVPGSKTGNIRLNITYPTD